MPPIKKEDKRKVELGKDGGMDENEDNAAEEKETVTWTRVKAEMESVKNEITNEMNRKMNGTLVFPESRISEFCDQWQCMDRGEGLSGSVMFSPTGNIRIVQDMQPPPK